MRGSGGEQSVIMAASFQPDEDMAELELALLRRGMDQRAAGLECCSRCRRSPLIGEWLYVYDRSRVLCELCRALERELPRESRLVHTAAFGHTIRILDQRAA
jgi:hypothetical protein